MDGQVTQIRDAYRAIHDERVDLSLDRDIYAQVMSAYLEAILYGLQGAAYNVTQAQTFEVHLSSRRVTAFLENGHVITTGDRLCVNGWVVKTYADDSGMLSGRTRAVWGRIHGQIQAGIRTCANPQIPILRLHLMFVQVRLLIALTLSEAPEMAAKARRHDCTLRHLHRVVALAGNIVSARTGEPYAALYASEIGYRVWGDSIPALLTRIADRSAEVQPVAHCLRSLMRDSRPYCMLFITFTLYCTYQCRHVPDEEWGSSVEGLWHTVLIGSLVRESIQRDVVRSLGFYRRPSEYILALQQLQYFDIQILSYLTWYCTINEADDVKSTLVTDCAEQLLQNCSSVQEMKICLSIFADPYNAFLYCVVDPEPPIIGCILTRWSQGKQRVHFIQALTELYRDGFKFSVASQKAFQQCNIVVPYMRV